MLFNTRPVLEVGISGRSYIFYHSILDSRSIHGQTNYLLIIISTFLTSFVFNFLPPLFLILYPIKAFQSCLSKCHVNSVALNIFVEKMHDCYRNGLDGGRDMRSFSGLYFFLRMMIYCCLPHAISVHHVPDFYSLGVFSLIITLIIALVKPYKKPFMNYLDVLLLSILTLVCFTASLCSTPILYWPTLQLIARVLLALPLVVIILFVVWRRFKGLTKCFSFRRAPLNIESPQNSTLNSPSASESIVKPTSTVFDYGTMK